MTRCWIRNTGGTEAAGPFSLEELRGLIRAGLLPMSASASTTAYEGFRIIAEWQELVEALNTPGVRVVRGVVVLKASERHLVPDTAGSESLMPEEKVSMLKLGRTDYEDVNRADTAPVVDAVGVLRANLAAEAELKLNLPPWYRNPFLRNVGRFLPIAALSAPLFYFGAKQMETNPYVGVPLFAAGGILFFGGAYLIFFVSPVRWGVD